MRNVTMPIYSFGELSLEVQLRVLRNFKEIRLNDGWSNTILQEAKEIGVLIVEFYPHWFFKCKGKFSEDATFTAIQIQSTHPENCKLYQLSEFFFEAHDAFVLRCSDGIHTDIVKDENIKEFDRLSALLENDLLSDLLGYFSSLLEKEYLKRISTESITMDILENHMEFTCDGKVIQPFLVTEDKYELINS